MNKLDLKILVCFTEELDNILKERIQSSDYYYPILGGACNNIEKIKSLNDDFYNNILLDNTGENISNINPYINELTVLYWAWKNYDKIDSEYIGLNHYRRFFNIAKVEDAINKNADIICATKKIVYPNIANSYYVCHEKNDYNMLCKIMEILYATNNKNIYYEFIDMCNSMFLYPCNMFIMKKEQFFNYCEFLFKIILILRNNIDVSKRDNYQKRAVGFLGERLTSFYIRLMQAEGKHVIPIDIDFYDKVDVSNMKYHRESK